MFGSSAVYVRYLSAHLPNKYRTSTEQVADNNMGYPRETYEMLLRKIGGRWEKHWREIGENLEEDWRGMRGGLGEYWR